MTREERDTFVEFLDGMISGAQHALDHNITASVPEVARNQKKRMEAAQRVLEELLQEPVDEGR